MKPDPHDYARSPLRFELDILLEEYRALRTEIGQRIAAEQQIEGFALGLIAATATASQVLPSILKDHPEALVTVHPAYLVVSLLFSTLALMILEQDAFLGTLGTYIANRVSPRLEQILASAGQDGVKPLGWDVFRAKFQFRNAATSVIISLMSASRYAMTIIPSSIFFIMYLANAGSFLQKPVWEIALFGFTATIGLAVFAGAAFSGYLFTSLPNRGRRLRTP